MNGEELKAVKTTCDRYIGQICLFADQNWPCYDQVRSGERSIFKTDILGIYIIRTCPVMIR